jgi:hypothetical protein
MRSTAGFGSLSSRKARPANQTRAVRLRVTKNPSSAEGPHSRTGRTSTPSAPIRRRHADGGDHARQRLVTCAGSVDWSVLVARRWDPGWVRCRRRRASPTADSSRSPLLTPAAQFSPKPAATYSAIPAVRCLVSRTPTRFQDSMCHTPDALPEVSRVGLTARAACTPFGWV